ncbi:hypothetical protein RG2014_014 [Delftia phage RG-2014]|uniref:Uncharacterized protein n=1 Tax=Delftia phage RG-2014 TaxID=1563661 RepID=A0A097PAL4_9CAUD|nr:hypothetical protein RG2014_014 [Delftia phage RG-2014]AIU44268.1 hypothetical protein RG2014_014 [Delftia phage RG-2014]
MSDKDLCLPSEQAQKLLINANVARREYLQARFEGPEEMQVLHDKMQAADIAVNRYIRDAEQRAAKLLPGLNLRWEFRWLNPGNQTVLWDGALDWVPVKPDVRGQTIEQKVKEIQGYTWQGKRCYAVRPVYESYGEEC